MRLSYRLLLAGAAIAVGTAITVVQGMGSRPTATAPPQNTPALSTHGSAILRSNNQLESLLVATLHLIQQNRLDEALNSINKVLDINPKFRLAQLIKGDLLLARTKPLTGMGTAASGASSESLADLRQEAMVRLQHYQTPPPTHLVPDYLLNLTPQQHYAIVVDTSKSRLYLFENKKGRPQYRMDYYITIGKKGFDKYREGDQRTPLGVYHVMSKLDQKKLPDLYGKAAYPVNYPNELDKKQGRTGHGIWLHGSPSDTYSRPPQASDGCVVLTNPDIESLGSQLEIGQTPVIIAPNIQWVSASEWERQRQTLRQAVEEWRKDWESRQLPRYFAHYSPEFWSDSAPNLAAWQTQKRETTQNKTWLKVELNNIGILRYPGNRALAVVTFDQYYRSDSLTQSAKKRQFWVKEGNTWKILYEGAGLPPA